MKSVAALTLAILSLPLWAQEDEVRPAYMLVVPVVANTIGVGEVNWRSDLSLTNASDVDAEVLLAMPGAPGEPFFLTTISAGASLSFADVVRETFGIASARAPLVIQSWGTPLIVTSVVRAYRSIDDNDPPAQSIPVVTPALRNARQALAGLAVNDQLRTNIGLTNLGDRPATFVLGLQVVKGRFVETASFVVPAYSTLQLPLQLIFPVVTRGSDLTVIIEPSGQLTYAWASVIENGSSRARFIAPAAATAASP